MEKRKEKWLLKNFLNIQMEKLPKEYINTFSKKEVISHENSAYFWHKTRSNKNGTSL